MSFLSFYPPKTTERKGLMGICRRCCRCIQSGNKRAVVSAAEINGVMLMVCEAVWGDVDMGFDSAHLYTKRCVFLLKFNLFEIALVKNAPKSPLMVQRWCW